MFARIGSDPIPVPVGPGLHLDGVPAGFESPEVPMALEPKPVATAPIDAKPPSSPEEDAAWAELERVALELARKHPDRALLALSKVAQLNRCRACGRTLSENPGIADGCECNAPRGVNHGIVPQHVCTCTQCDPQQTGAVRPKPPQLATPDNTYGTAAALVERLRADAVAAGVGPCPKCGSPEPRLHPAVQFEGEVQPCDHPFHAASAPNLRFTGAGGAIPTGFAAPVYSEYLGPERVVAIPTGPQNDLAFEQYKIALSLQRHVERFREKLAPDTPRISQWARTLLGAGPTGNTVDARIPIDEVRAVCLAASVDAGDVESSRLSLRGLGGLAGLLRLLWSQRSLVTLLGEYEVARRAGDLGPVSALVARLRAEATAMQYGHVRHEVSHLVSKLPESEPVSIPVKATSKSTDIALAEHMRRTLPGAYSVPFHSWHSAAVRLREALGLAEKPDEPGALQKRIAEDVAHRASYSVSASDTHAADAHALELWSLLDDIANAAGTHGGHYEGLAKFALERAQLRLAILSKDQHAGYSRFLPPDETELARRARDSAGREHYHICLRRARQWAQPVPSDANETALNRAARSEEANGCAEEISWSLGQRKQYSSAIRDQLLALLGSLTNKPDAVARVLEEILVLFDR
jgi:hypothetical protein